MSSLEIFLWIFAAIWLLGTALAYFRVGRLLTTDSPGFRFLIALVAWPWLLLS